MSTKIEYWLDLELSDVENKLKSSTFDERSKKIVLINRIEKKGLIERYEKLSLMVASGTEADIYTTKNINYVVKAYKFPVNAVRIHSKHKQIYKYYQDMKESDKLDIIVPNARSPFNYSIKVGKDKKTYQGSMEIEKVRFHISIEKPKLNSIYRNDETRIISINKGLIEKPKPIGKHKATLPGTFFEVINKYTYRSKVKEEIEGDDQESYFIELSDGEGNDVVKQEFLTKDLFKLKFKYEHTNILENMGKIGRAHV